MIPERVASARSKRRKGKDVRYGTKCGLFLTLKNKNNQKLMKQGYQDYFESTTKFNNNLLGASARNSQRKAMDTFINKNNEKCISGEVQ